MAATAFLLFIIAPLCVFGVLLFALIAGGRADDDKDLR